MDKIKEFYELADSYCHYIVASEMTIGDVKTLMKLLMKLYLSAIDLPEKTPETIGSVVSDKTDETRITFGKQIPRIYWEVYDPFVQEDSVCGDIVDDLSDIANDLQQGIDHITGKLVNES